MQVSVRQAGRELSRLINQAVYGSEHITITSRGRPKAVLLSVEEYERLAGDGGARREALNEARRLREAFAARHGILSVDLVQTAREEREARMTSVLVSQVQGGGDEPRR
jgi:prevent-host-death family protein